MVTIYRAAHVLAFLLVVVLPCFSHVACDQLGAGSKTSIHEVLVYDPRTSAPIAGATVHLYRENYTSPSLLETVTDSRGIAVFDVPREMARPGPDAVWHEIASADGYTSGGAVTYHTLVGWYGTKIALTKRTK